MVYHVNKNILSYKRYFIQQIVVIVKNVQWEYFLLGIYL